MVTQAVQAQLVICSGGITALFSGLAFAGLVTTLFMQRKELSLQRDELRQTREVFLVQRFENTFFGLIRLLNEHIESILIDTSQIYIRSGVHTMDKSHVVGRTALIYIANHLPTCETYENDHESSEGNAKVLIEQTDVNKVIKIYEEEYEQELEGNLGPYFRLIYNILRHIEYTDFHSDEERNQEIKLMYSKILRAHFNSSEIKLLMFNCASIHGSGLKGWIEKHSLLRHIKRSDYEAYKPIVDLYEPLAFRFEERKSRSKQ